MPQTVEIVKLSPKESLIKCFRTWNAQWQNYKGEGPKPMSIDEFSEFLEMNFEIKFKEK